MGAERERECGGCGEAVGRVGPLLRTEALVYHAACAKCWHSGRRLGGGAEYAAAADGRLYCASCQGPLEREAWGSVHLRHHHLSCLRCAVCLEPLGPGALGAASGQQLLHPACAQRLSLDRQCGVSATAPVPSTAATIFSLARPTDGSRLA